MLSFDTIGIVVVILLQSTGVFLARWFGRVDTCHPSAGDMWLEWAEEEEGAGRAQQRILQSEFLAQLCPGFAMWPSWAWACFLHV